jgi:hypothetical protein
MERDVRAAQGQRRVFLRLGQVIVHDQLGNVSQALAEWGVMGDRFVVPGEQGPYAVHRSPAGLGQFRQCGFAMESAGEVAADALDFVELLHGVHRKPNSAGSADHAPVDGLPDPPNSVGGELVPGREIEFLHRAQQPKVAVLHEIHDRNSAAGVVFRDANHQAQVRLDEAGLRTLAVPGKPGQVPGSGRIGNTQGESLGREEAHLDPPGQVDLLLHGEKVHSADLSQGVTECVR